MPTPCHHAPAIGVAATPRRSARPLVRSAARQIARATGVLAVLAATAAVGQAQIVYSGILNRVIPATNTGLFQNVVTGTFYTGPTNFPDCPGAGCNYDFALYGGATSNQVTSFYSPTGTGQVSPVPLEQRGYVAGTATGTPIALDFGTTIGSSSAFNTFNPSTEAFVGGTARIFGFRFRNEEGGANTLHYGWARITIPTTGAGTLVDYAFEATPGASIGAGATPAPAVIPEPTTFALGAVGGLALAVTARRRRRVRT